MEDFVNLLINIIVMFISICFGLDCLSMRVFSSGLSMTEQFCAWGERTHRDIKK